VKFVLGQIAEVLDFEYLLRHFGKWSSLQEQEETSDVIKLFEVKQR